MNPWPVEHFFPHFLTGLLCTQSVFNWSEVHLYRNDFLQNPYFSWCKIMHKGLKFQNLVCNIFLSCCSRNGLKESQTVVCLNIFWFVTSQKNNVCLIYFHIKCNTFGSLEHLQIQIDFSWKSSERRVYNVLTTCFHESTKLFF